MTLPPDDRGFTLGDGLFETVLAEEGALALWDAHVARLLEGCTALGLPQPAPASLLIAARDALRDAGLQQGRAAVRLTWTAGSGGRGLDRPDAPSPRLIATAAPAPMPTNPVTLAIAGVRRNDGSIASRLKTLSYLDNVLARREAQAAGADEAVMLNTRGEVACAAAANIFWEREGRLYTPKIACGVLPGVVRAAVIEAARGLGVAVEESRSPVAELARTQAAFITNSLIGIREVARLDGAVLASSRLIQQVAQSTFWDLRGRR